MKSDKQTFKYVVKEQVDLIAPVALTNWWFIWETLKLFEASELI